MQNSHNSDTVAGLPGKNIRPGWGFDRARNTPGPRYSSPRPSPLGISINTNVQPASNKKPRQLFPARPDVEQTISRQASRSIHRKQKPSLKLGKEISPFDRDIPICFSPQTLSGNPAVLHDSRLSPQNVKTPCIIITPIEEEFGQSSPFTRKDDIGRHYGGLHAHSTRGARVASSVYSPFDAAHDTIKASGLHRPRSGSASTLYDVKGKPSSRSARLSRQASLDSILPTPRRSVGWWNLLASPLPRKASTRSHHHPDDGPEDENERTPLIEKAAGFGVTEAENVRSLDDAETRRQIEESPFYHYSLPETGEAAKYFDLSYDPTGPWFANDSRALSSPAPLSSATTTRSMSPATTKHGRDSRSSMDSDDDSIHHVAKKVPSPTPPAQTPPKSSVAAMVDYFRTPALIQQKRKSATPELLGQATASTVSPTPMVEMAQVEYFQRVKTPKSRAGSVSTQQTTRPTTKHSPPHDHTQEVSLRTFRSSNRDGRTPPSSPAPAAVASTNASPQQLDSFRGNFRAGTPVTQASSPTTSHRSKASRPPLRAFNHKMDDHLAEYYSQSELLGGNQRYYSDEDPEKVHLAKKDLKEDDQPTHRSPHSRWMFIAIAILILVAVGAIVSVVIKYTAYKDTGPATEMAWYNASNFPLIPTGISTVAQPNIVQSSGGCVNNTEMWTCALPKEQQIVAPNTGPAPNFRFSIFLSNRATHPIPCPPSIHEQTFLGNTTDGTSAPYAGEQTPFHISVLPTTSPPQIVSKRSLPPPSIQSNGKSRPPHLYPLPAAQPLRLFDRSLDTEHYGFYTYFPRTIFMSLSPSEFPTPVNSTTITTNITTSNGSGNETNININGGAPESNANAICTFTQTRFHVQLWTRKSDTLLPPKDGYTLPNNTTSNTTSAFDFSTPGSMPLPVTITLDRHGGEASEKGVVCYGYDSHTGTVMQDVKWAVSEDRAIGGGLVNAAKAFEAMGEGMGQGGVEKGLGGVDGGSGGCACSWQSFEP